MKSRALIVASVLTTMLCAYPLEFALCAEKDSNAIFVRGANSMSTFINHIAEQYNAEKKDTQVIVFGGGTSGAFESMFEKKADLVMASRPLLEKEIQAGAISGMNPHKVLTTTEAIAFVTGKHNSVDNLTIEQLQRIYEGEITNWREVGGPDRNIEVYASPDTSGLSLYLKKNLLKSGFFGPQTKFREHFSSIIREVGMEDKWAIGCADLSRATLGAKKGDVKIIGLKSDSESETVKPAPETVKSGSYPMVMPMYIYWDHASVAEPAKEFVEYCADKLRGVALTELTIN